MGLIMEACSHCSHMKTENKALRKSMIETNKQYVLAVNENLALRRFIENLTGSGNPVLDTV